MSVSDEELKVRLLAILEDADLNVVTERIIRKQLEEDFQCTLTDKKEFIRGEVGIFLKAKQEAEYAAVSAKKKRKPKKSDEEKAENRKRVGAGGLNKVCLLSPDLSELFGVTEMPRTQVVKEVWNYIKEHNLQDPSNKRHINCDDTMEKILGTKHTDMFQMNKLLSKHIISKPVDPSAEPENKKLKAVSTSQHTFRVEQPLSPELQSFLGSGEAELPRQEVVKRMWTYIKENDLQDPNDKRRILCDEKLELLFGVEFFNGFGITKLLSPHIGVKTEEIAKDSSENDEGGGGVAIKTEVKNEIVGRKEDNEEAELEEEEEDEEEEEEEEN